MNVIYCKRSLKSAWIELQLAHVDKNLIRGTYQPFSVSGIEGGDDAVVRGVLSNYV